MKVEFHEFDHAYTFFLTPETVAETAKLVRLGLTAKRLKGVTASIMYPSDTPTAHVSIARQKNARELVGGYLT